MTQPALRIRDQFVLRSNAKHVLLGADQSRIDRQDILQGALEKFPGQIHGDFKPLDHTVPHGQYGMIPILPQSFFQGGYRQFQRFNAQPGHVIIS